MKDELGGTLHINGHVHYNGSRDELVEKLRRRDDEIDRLRERIKKLEYEIECWEETIYSKMVDERDIT